MAVTVSGTQPIDARVREWVEERFGPSALLREWAIRGEHGNTHSLEVSIEFPRARAVEMFSLLLPFVQDWPCFYGRPEEEPIFYGRLLVNVNDFEPKDEA